jgi:2OG-Fe(II) oxygenase superfamily
MFIFDDVCDAELIEAYRLRIQTHHLKMLEEGNDYMAWYPTRNIKISDDPIVKYIQDFLESRIRMTTYCYECIFQTWPIGTHSPFHNHTDPFFNRQHGDYNGILYLNDDFGGGEFVTKGGILIKPKNNRLIFFDGSTVQHGVRQVHNNHRYTIVFWWQDTKFLAP